MSSQRLELVIAKAKIHMLTKWRIPILIPMTVETVVDVQTITEGRDLSVTPDWSSIGTGNSFTWCGTRW